ncbi:MAG: hypothetical protein IPK13_16875 [Deltaproteobacteria bacterium]|nr:hypothetical protein [Deltaproteobacteria bacterium]
MFDPLSARGLSLLLSMLAIAIGPVAFSLLRRTSRGLSFMDGLVLGSVGSLLLFHVVPEALEAGGGLAGLALLLGPVLPLALEKVEWAGQGRSARFAAVLGALVVLVHGVMDGAALGDAPPSARALSWAIVSHRVIDGALLWWLLRRSVGRNWTLLILGVLGAATVLGFFITLDAHAHGSPAMSAFEAFVAGTLLFLLASHRSSAATKDDTCYAPPHSARSSPTASRPDPKRIPSIDNTGERDASDSLTRLAALMGVALGLSVTWVIPFDHSVLSFMQRLTQTSQATAPAILAGYIGLMICDRLLVLTNRPRARAFIRETNLEALPLAIMILGPGAGMLWLGMHATSTFLARQSQPLETHETHETSPSGLAVLDETIGRAWIGIYTAALLVQPLFDLSPWPPLLTIPLAALAGGCFRISALGALPIAAALIALGAPVGAGLAFGLAAARNRAPPKPSETARNSGLYLIRSAWFQRLGMAVAAGVIAHGLTDGPRIAWSPPAWHPAAVALLGLLVFSLVRRGPFALIDGLVNKRAHGSHGRHPPF